ncbi:MAG: mandelate racemase/muconate lactonizing enzyme family protein [Salana multivorans]|uniref:mandelate racemase/muconate lactonizing enzyme family protein n=1 Tax=Salana multivorans TaxID=120377 RepID=UPI000968CB47|nr:mandelate racemase/muconate lactonizing enzyme family protein [Salana multivorans]MBN8883735.1 mandelate racemase/muconate lactonizing enzyme family protein [Salana multivorans]OJX97024.1 MAG: mandelate racemase [Micrococcales bacterium 73-15]
MIIDSIDFFYGSMPEVTLEADGSQDALLVRVATDDGSVGWGECEASPLVSIAAFVAPRSHGVCQPVSASVIGQRIDGVADIERLTRLVGRNSMDLLQAAHTWSGIEIALWDLLGRRLGEPVWRLLGYERSHPKVPYASMLMGDSPQLTLERAREARARGFLAVKVGWGGYGTGTAREDADHVAAAREGVGPDGVLLVDAGQIWVDDLEAAAARLAALQAADALWLEEPFVPYAFGAHARLAELAGSVGIAGGEGAHNPHMAINLIELGGVRFIQVDAARIGGIGPARQVADVALASGVTYVNHTFTSHLALSASLQPFAGLATHRICEYPAEPKQLALDLSRQHIALDANGEIAAPDAPGLGIDVDPAGLSPYLRDVEILVDGRTLFASPSLPGEPARARLAATTARPAATTTAPASGPATPSVLDPSRALQ